MAHNRPSLFLVLVERLVHHLFKLVHRGMQPLEKLGDFVGSDNERGADGDGVHHLWVVASDQHCDLPTSATQTAHHTNNHPMLLRQPHKLGSRAQFRLERRTRARALVRNQLEPSKQPNRPRVTDVFARVEGGDTGSERRGHVAHVLHEVAFVHDFEGFDGDRGRDGVARVGD